MLEFQEHRIGHVGLFKAELLDRMLADDLVDALDVARTGVRHADREAGEVVFGSFNIAAVGEIIRAVFCHNGNALGNAILRRVEPVILACQQQRIDLAGFQQTLVLFNVFHSVFSFFPMR